ncbi:MAG: aromatic ring-hydroxylating dioxygenase subunit alpha [Gammaproteobacteria bacterium]|jgi:phenylpropionate dioxygenase-like ring-hydroxylating dioxygenase large terminal subunit
MYINFWYPICTTEQLNEENPRRIEMLGVRLVAFRDDAGNAHVLADTCIHRGGSLSKGKVIDNCVRCPYHGWRFDGDGKCVEIPSMEGKAPPARAKVDSYPVEEKYGIVFAFLGDLPESERPPLQLVGELDQEGWQFSGPIDFEIEAYYERSIENGLDPVHNEFVHPAQGAPRLDEDQLTIESSEWGNKFVATFGELTDKESHDQVVERAATGDLRAGSWHTGPNALVTEIHIPGNNSFIQYFYEAPLSKNGTRIFFVNMRNNNLDPSLDSAMNTAFMKVADEDRVVIEGLWPKNTPDTLTKELMTPGDAAVVKFRESLKTWEENGWRIDMKKMAEDYGDVAYAIPCPARRESKNWVLDPIPLIPGKNSA